MDRTMAMPGGGQARLVVVDEPADVASALARLGLTPPRPVVLLVGGAGLLPAEADADVAALFQALAPVLDDVGAVAVDGGTDSGVMGLIGRARAAAGATFPLVGVAPAGMVEVPEAPARWHAGDDPGDAVALEPHHTHFLIVPGDRFGDERAWIEQVVRLLSGDHPSVTLLVNGGDLAWKEVEGSVARGEVVVVAAGSGRAADELAAGSGARARRVVRDGDIRVLPASDPAGISALIGDVLTNRTNR